MVGTEADTKMNELYLLSLWALQSNEKGRQEQKQLR
jgi:hypothetical protein